MIVKLVKAGGIAHLIQCDEVMYQPTAHHTIDLEIFKGGDRKKRVIIGDATNPTAEWEVAYVTIGGKTCDTIRQTLREPIQNKGYLQGRAVKVSPSPNAAVG